MLEIVALAGDASGPVSEHVRQMYVFFVSTERLNRDASAKRPSNGDELSGYMKSREHAEHDLRDCLAILQRHVVDRKLQSAEKISQQQRAISIQLRAYQKSIGDPE